MLGFALAATANAQEADIELTKEVSHTVASPGSNLSYVLRVENFGPDIAANVMVVDELSPRAAFVSASPECFYEDVGHEVICLSPELVPGMILEFLIEVVADVLPADAEIGVSLTGEAPSAVQPAAALIAARTGNQELISVDDHLMTPRGIAREAGGPLLVADQGDPMPSSGGLPIIDGRIIRLDRTTGSQTLLSSDGELLNPTGIVVDHSGRIFVADPTGPELPDQFGRVLEIDPVTGDQSVLATRDLLEQPIGLTVLDTGELAIIDAVGKLVRVDPETGDQTLISEYGELVQPQAVAQLAPEAVVVADAVTGLVRVDIATGEQTVIVPIDGIDLVEPTDIEVDHAGMCWVSDPSFGEQGGVLRFDPEDGSLVESFTGADVWSSPRGHELHEVLVNLGRVSSTTTDPDPFDNSDWVATDIEDGYVPTVEVTVSETVTVTDGVLVDVISAVIIEVIETITVADAIGVLPAVFIEVNETVIVDDAVVARPAITINLAEAINVSDAVTAAPLLPVEIQITETITVDDQVVEFPSVVINLSETVSVSDVVSAQPLLPVEITVTESITVTDQIQVTPAAVIAVTEQITVTDVPQLSVQAIVTIDVEETVAVTDQVGVIVETPLFVDGFESGDTSAWASTTGG